METKVVGVPGTYSDKPTTANMLFQQTGVQVVAMPTTGWTSHLREYTLSGFSDPVFYSKLRKVANHPKVSMALDYSVGEMLSIPYHIDSELPEYETQLIETEMKKILLQIIQQGYRNMLIYGWAGFEIVWKFTDDGLFCIDRLIPLLHDFTHINIDAQGAFFGFEQLLPHSTKGAVHISVAKSLLINIDQEGTNYYGTSALNKVVPYWEDWQELNNRINQFFDNNVGAYFVLYYPPGTADDGTPNIEIAKAFLQNLLKNSKAGLCLPSTLQPVTYEATNSADHAWQLSTVTLPMGNVAAYIERQHDLDEMMVNVLGQPIRIFMEGRHSGSYSELTAYTEIAHSMQESRQHSILYQIEKQILNRFVSANFGADAVKLVSLQHGNTQDYETLAAMTGIMNPQKQKQQQREMAMQQEAMVQQPENLV